MAGSSCPFPERLPTTRNYSSRSSQPLCTLALRAAHVTFIPFVTDILQMHVLFSRRMTQNATTMRMQAKTYEGLLRLCGEALQSTEGRAWSLEHGRSFSAVLHHPRWENKWAQPFWKRHSRYVFKAVNMPSLPNLGQDPTSRNVV